MTAKNDLTAIVRQFFPKEATCSIEVFGTGLINDTYRVQFADEETAWLLQRLNHYVFPQPEKVMENIRLIADHLLAQHYREVILEPVRTLAGKLLYQDDAGNYWRIFPFFSHTFSIDQASNSEQVRLAGQAYGTFSRSLAGLEPSEAGIHETIPGFHDSLSRLAFFEEVMAKAPVERITHAKEEIKTLREHQSLFHEIDALDLPQRITHNDTKVNNILFNGQTRTVSGVIDWDTIMPGTILSDFGDMVRTMTPTYDENHQDIAAVEVIGPFFEALCQGFLPAVKTFLQPVEVENLVRGGLWITLEQALRFLTDYLNGDVYYKTTFPDQNLLRTRNQLALFHSLRKEEKGLDKMVQSIWRDVQSA